MFVQNLMELSGDRAGVEIRVWLAMGIAVFGGAGEWMNAHVE